MIDNKLLLIQLKRLKLSGEKRPDNDDQWKAFLALIDRSYEETEQGRYLLERSMDISSREMRDLNEQISDAARRVGMAEVSTSILHNVGNVLNSVNISIELILERLRESKFEMLFKAVEQIKNNIQKSDPDKLQNIKLSEYLQAALQSIEEDQRFSFNEIKQLQKHIFLINGIVDQQQSLSGNKGIIEMVSIPELIDESIRICGGTFKEKYGIEIIKDFELNEEVRIDKSRFIQILVNLLLNAKDAVNHSREPEKLIKIELKKIDTDTIQLNIIDNGIGIDEENLDKIFNFGYTTKASGHGYGLHSSAIAAEQMGGSLKVSKNIGNSGVTFTLNLHPSKIYNESHEGTYDK